MSGLAHFVRKVFKLKRQSGDILPKIEGEKCKDWLAMDLGNILLVNKVFVFYIQLI